MFTLTIKTDSAAFDLDAGGVSAELARILRDLALRIDRGSDVLHVQTGSLYDINGNRVGEWRFDA